MTPGGTVAPSAAHETQLPNESPVEHNPASSAAELNTMITSSIYDDTSDADGYLGADEKVGMASLMDGHNSENEPLEEEEYSGEDGSPSDDDKDADDNDADDNDADDNDADDNDSDGNSSADSLANYQFGNEIICKVLDQVKDIITGNQDMTDKIDKLESEVDNYKRQAESHARRAKRMKRNSDHTQKTLEDEIHQLTCDLNQKADHDVVKEENEKLRQELFETKAELQKELNEKADYHDVSEQRREFHRELVEKISTCRDLEWKVGQLQRQLNEKIDNCEDLEKKVAELQRESDEEASFSAQIAAMISKRSKK